MSKNQVNGDVDHDLYKLGFGTRALHAGQEPDQWNSRAVVPPIVMSTTFAQFAPAVHAGYEYGRSGNPTRNSLQKCLASLDKAKFALVYASGLATQANITQLLKEGDNIVAGDELYGGTNRYFRTCAAKFGISIDYVNFSKPENVERALKSNTKLVWFETPTNPLLKVTDIEAICKIVKKFNSDIIIVVDNTFLSPYFQSPLNFGVDIVMNSITKYINGHSDVIMGSISTNRSDLHQQLKYVQNAVGAVPSPFDCFLVNRGMKTLALRMEQHQKNALAVAKFLEEHPLVRKVIYLGLKSHPQYDVIKKQCSGFGGMVCMYINGNLETVKAFLEKLKLFTLAESLGAVESLVEVPSIMTHASLPPELRKELGIDDTLVRLSVGIENTDDLIQDLDQALKYANSL
ncbi:hypothetical protein RDWZM_002630 [Blomia tropicalis]|uniref:cystathionine gamma-lyase n=1 Tax=Blomia tropicalis TaxID=40697 RepID=A0A9Q0MDW4_BLOTA|nr:hypothetical protein BLOT_001535 [Blomia tropicalis]KAJ6224085.1 hypothetical protein RDWZM_002630 [Blomia tropicalis]